MIVILGSGLAGLSAGYVLSKGQKKVTIVDENSDVGGLSRTIKHKEFKFDLGGHRFITKDEKIDRFVKELLGDKFVVVPRTSQIYLQNKFFDYPLSTKNALFGMGLVTTFNILLDYLKATVKRKINPPKIVSLEDWVVNKFGRKMFDLYFKQYSEKVWGIKCDEISAEWVASRIKGLSLRTAVMNAVLKVSGKEIVTLADQFVYPRDGIGVMSDAMKEGIDSAGNSVIPNTRVTRIFRDGLRITAVETTNGGKAKRLKGDKYVSSIPITELVKSMEPAPPDEIISAADKLRYRDLVIVTLMLDCDRATDLTWMYLPEKDMAVGRIHEPKNWSVAMGPKGKTHIVAEYFAFENDEIWGSSDEELRDKTVACMNKLGVMKKAGVVDYCVVRVPKAYPLFAVGFRKEYNILNNYIMKFENLRVIGRTGTFEYLNMDLSIKSGVDAAEEILEGESGKRREAVFSRDYVG